MALDQKDKEVQGIRSSEGCLPGMPGATTRINMGTYTRKSWKISIWVSGKDFTETAAARNNMETSIRC